MTPTQRFKALQRQNARYRGMAATQRIAKRFYLPMILATVAPPSAFRFTNIRAPKGC